MGRAIKVVISQVFVVLALSAVASAALEDPKAIRKIEALNLTAMEDYDIGEYEDSRKQLQKAVEIIKLSQLERHAVTVTTYLNLGIVHAGGFKANDLAITAWKTALEINPAAMLPAHKRVTAELTALFEQAKGKPKAPNADGEVDDPSKPVTGMKHSPVDAAAEGMPIEIQVRVGKDVKAKKVVLSYRPLGAKDYQAVPMKQAAGVYTAVIPADATAVDQIQYFVDARNAKAKVVASRGNAATPFVIAIARTKQAAEEGAEETEDEENPLDDLKKKKK